MAKLFIFIAFSVIFGVNFSTTLAQKPKFGSGQAGNNLIRGSAPGSGLINELADRTAFGLNDAICRLVGPNFLRAALTDDCCLSGAELPTLFQSYKCYCEIFNRQPPNKKKCLSDAAARVQIGLKSIIKLDLLLAKCCETCDGDKNFGSKNTLTNFFTGQNLVRLGISRAGLLGSLFTDLADGTNQSLCTLLGPNFLQLLFDGCKGCPGGIVLSAFKSFESFCQYFNSAPANKRKCLTDGAARIKLPSIFRVNLIIGQCCAQCAENGNNLPQSPSCKPAIGGNDSDGCENDVEQSEFMY